MLSFLHCIRVICIGNVKQHVWPPFVCRYLFPGTTCMTDNVCVLADALVECLLMSSVCACWCTWCVLADVHGVCLLMYMVCACWCTWCVLADVLGVCLLMSSVCTCWCSSYVLARDLAVCLLIAYLSLWIHISDRLCWIRVLLDRK